MDEVEIWVNPACSKCRSATAELDAAGIAYTVRRYLEDPPSPDELRTVLGRMGLDPWHIARPAEARAAGIEIPKDAEHREEWIAAMVADPRIIQRPIITATDGTTVVARDAGSLADVVRRERG